MLNKNYTSTLLTVTVTLSGHLILLGIMCGCQKAQATVISTSARGEISSNKQISLPSARDRDDKKWKSVMGSEVEVCFKQSSTPLRLTNNRICN